MDAVLTALHSDLTALASTLKSGVPGNEALNVAHQLWNLPGITRDELVGSVESLLQSIEKVDSELEPQNAELLSDYRRRITFITGNVIQHIWGSNGGQAVSVLLITLDGLRKALKPENLEIEDVVQKLGVARTLAKTVGERVRALDATLTSLEPKTSSLGEMVARIEAANATADQLPVNLASLSEATQSIGEMRAEAEVERLEVGECLSKINQAMSDLDAKRIEAENIVAKCGKAYAITTSHGLAAAFSERSKSLSTSMWVWVVGLIVALGLGSIIGSGQLKGLEELMKEPNVGSMAIAVNLVLALLSVGSTVWFAWVATKQIGQRFRLAEDYGFKASVSRAYEGYRREAESIDNEFVSRLFSSALSRLDEQPLRLVETATHGSPWHEAASSDLIKKALATVPGFMDQVFDLAKSATNKAPVVKPAVVASQSPANPV